MVVPKNLQENEEEVVNMLKIKVDTDKKVLEIDGQIPIIDFLFSITTGLPDWRAYSISTTQSASTNDYFVKYDTQNLTSTPNFSTIPSPWVSNMT